MNTSLSTLYDVSLTRRPICVLAACDDKYAFCLFAALQTLLKNSPRLAQQADIWVAGFDLSASSKCILSSLPHTNVIDYVFPGKYPDLSTFAHFTQASFARYECFTLLHLYEKVMYLDSDVLVQKELLPLFDTLQEGLGLVKDPAICEVGRNFFKPVAGFDMQRPNFNSGFLALKRSRSWDDRLDDIKQFLYQSTVQYAPDLYYPDQGIINLALEKFALKPTQLSDLYNCPASRNTFTLQKAFIIHATGPRKFWCYYYFRDFYTSYTQWIKLGGPKVTVRGGDSALYKKFIQATGWDRYIFVQLCPDFIAKPLKALRFGIKKLLHCKF